jgi:hypothetical protein
MTYILVWQKYWSNFEFQWRSLVNLSGLNDLWMNLFILRILLITLLLRICSHKLMEDVHRKIQTIFVQVIRILASCNWAIRNWSQGFQITFATPNFSSIYCEDWGSLLEYSFISSLRLIIDSDLYLSTFRPSWTLRYHLVYIHLHIDHLDSCNSNKLF